MEIVIGLLIIAIGAFCQSSCYVPINKIKDWSWESYWIVQGVFAWLAFPLAGALLAVPFSAMSCSTLVVGKNVSETGKILVGHNEDNGGRIFNPQYWVPHAKHKAGEMIVYEPTAAKIPQVKLTADGVISIKKRSECELFNGYSQAGVYTFHMKDPLLSDCEMTLTVEEMTAAGEIDIYVKYIDENGTCR